MIFISSNITQPYQLEYHHNPRDKIAFPNYSFLTCHKSLSFEKITNLQKHFYATHTLLSPFFSSLFLSLSWPQPFKVESYTPRERFCLRFLLIKEELLQTQWGNVGPLEIKLIIPALCEKCLEKTLIVICCDINVDWLIKWLTQYYSDKS